MSKSESRDQGYSDGRSGAGYSSPHGTESEWQNSESDCRQYDLGYREGHNDRMESGERVAGDDDGRA